MKRILSLFLSVLLLVGMMSMTVMATEVEDESLQELESTISVSNGTIEVCEEVIETATYPIVQDASTYDYETSEHLLFTHILQNNSGVTEEKALKMAHQLIEKTREINESITSTQTDQSVDEVSLEGIYYLGRIVNGEIVEGTSTYTTGYDQMIPGDWISEPTRTKHSLSVLYTKAWLCCDSYKSSTGTTITSTSELSVSLQLGWTATGGLTKSLAESFDIDVTPTSNSTSSVSVGFELKADPWTKTAVRPYIYYYMDTYSGVRGFHCFNSITGEYYYMTAEVYGQDINLHELGIRTWTRTNDTKNSALTSPALPEEWEW